MFIVGLKPAVVGDLSLMVLIKDCLLITLSLPLAYLSSCVRCIRSSLCQTQAQMFILQKLRTLNNSQGSCTLTTAYWGTLTISHSRAKRPALNLHSTFNYNFPA